MNRSTLSRRSFLSCAGAAVIGAAWPPKLSFAQGAQEVRIAYGSTVAWAVDVIAIEEKLYEKAGLRVRVRPLESGKAIRDAMVAGAVDIGPMAATPFVIGAAKSDLVGVVVTSYFGSINLVQVRYDSPIRNVKDLRGKKVGTQVGSLSHSVLVEKLAPAYGLKPGDYEIINIGNNGLVPALAAGTVDAVTSLEPYAGMAEHEKIARTLTNFAQFDLMPTLMVVRGSYLDQNEAEVVGVLKAWLAAEKVFHTDRARTVAIVRRKYEMQGYAVPPAVLARALERLRVQPDITGELRVYLTEQAETLRRAGTISQLPAWNRSLRPDLLRKARGQL